MKKVLSRIREVPFLVSNARFGPMSFLRIALSPLRSKVSALTLGASGLGLFGTAQSFQNLAFSLSGLGIGSGLTTAVSRAVKKGDWEEAQKAVDAAWSILFISNLVFCGILLMLYPWLSAFVYAREGLAAYLIPAILSLPFFAIGTCYLEAILYGLDQDGASASAYWKSAIADAFVFCSLSYALGVKGALISLFFLPFSLALFQYLELRKRNRSLKLFRVRWHMPEQKNMLKTGAVMLAGGAVTYYTALHARALIAKEFGDAANGYYQVVLALSSVYTPFLTNAVWVRLFPQAGGHGLNASVFIEWTEALIYTALFAATAQMLLMLKGDWVVHLLYSKEFLPAADILPWRLLGDYFFLIAQPVLGVLVGLQHRRKYFLGIFLSQSIFLAGMHLFVASGLRGVLWAYTLSNIFLALFGLEHYLSRAWKNEEHRRIGLMLPFLLLFPALMVAAEAHLYLHDSPLWMRVGLLAAFVVFFYGGLYSGRLAEVLHLRWKSRGIGVAPKDGMK